MTAPADVQTSAGQRMRECGGCEGAGNLHDQAACDHEHCHAIERCGACNGSGQVPDYSGARADALADAETLRDYLGEHIPRVEGWALAVMDIGYGVRRYVRRGWGARASDAATHAARAAFRAVPALRGEES